MIEGFFVKQVRGNVTEELAVASRCFKNECSILDHADRSTLLEIYAERATNPHLSRSGDFPDNPSDEQLVEGLERGQDDYSLTPALEYYEEEEAHQENRSKWPELVGEIFSQSNRQAFQRRFGLDIWSSFVSLPDDGTPDGFGYPHATIAYLTLPNSIERLHKWSGNLRETCDGDILHEFPSTHGENGFGVAVNVNRRPSPEELSRFLQALKSLKLKVFVHPTQKQYPALGLGPPYEHEKLDAPSTPGPTKGPQKSQSSVRSAEIGNLKRTATSSEKDNASESPFPSLMLLTRKKD